MACAAATMPLRVNQFGNARDQLDHETDPSTGAETSIVVSMACRPIWVTTSAVIAVLLYWKLFTIDPTTRYHPSAKTNRISLNGREITTGGSNIMPIDIRTLATTMSTIRNGM